MDSVNITDNQTAMVRMSSWAASLLLIQEGLEPNYQMVCRDRNRLAMQADILGAYAHGIRNMLCLSGDHQQFGDHPQAKGVFDIDSMQLIKWSKGCATKASFSAGPNWTALRRCSSARPPILLPTHSSGASIAWPKKSKPACDFIQTQCIYNMEKFRKWIQQANDMGLTEKVYILAGVTPMKSVGMAKLHEEQGPRHGRARRDHQASSGGRQGQGGR